jgi:two-component system LytT family response regulator
MSAALRVLVVDDEPLARETLENLVATDPQLVVCGASGDGPSAVSAVLRELPDLLLLDIQMPGMNGFEVLEELLLRLEPEEMPRVVFVTAYDHFALRAFEYHALDYLLKPFTDERFHRAMEHAKQQLRTSREPGVRQKLVALLRELDPARSIPVSATERFGVSMDGSVTFLDYREVVWFEAANHYVLVHTQGKSHICRESMVNLETRLDPSRFVRIHRSAIVNLDYIRELRTEGRDEHRLVLKTGQRLAVSRRRLPRLRQLLGLQ